METATDIKLQLMTWENRSFHHALTERIDNQNEALRRLTEMVAENRAILLAIAERLDVTYEKPAAGFAKE